MYSLPPPDRAAFATSARLLSCLVTESLLKTLYIPVSCSLPPLTGVALLLSNDSSNTRPPYPPTDIFALVPLCHVPVLKLSSKSEIGLLDPLDMLPFVYELQDCDKASKECDPLSAAVLSALKTSYVSKYATTLSTLGPLRLWKKYSDALDLSEDIKDTVMEELSNSMLWQRYTYEHPPPTPTFESPSIVWEQCIIEGHPTHPMHKTRRTVEPMAPMQPGDYDLYHPRIRMVSISRSRMNIQGAWDDLVAPIRAEVARRANADFNIPDDEVLVPVHELQIVNIQDKFPEAHIYPPEFALDGLAQQSIRTVLVPGELDTHCLKLPLGMYLTSAMRTISPASAYTGPRFSKGIVPLLTYDRALLIVQLELASVFHVDSNQEVAKHFACQVREAYENSNIEAHGERVIVCSALTEMRHDEELGDIPLVQTTFGLDTEDKRLVWLDTYIDLYLRAFLPPVINNGVAFEGHPQNSLARFDATTRKLKGFAIRDFGGLKIHTPTLLASTGLSSLDEYFMPEHSVLTNTLEAVYTRLYHTAVHNHLQQLIRVLGLHHNGKGWASLRHHLRVQLPRDHVLANLWLGPETKTLPGKSFMRMRMKGIYRTHIHAPFPNLIQYEGSDRHGCSGL